MMKNILFIVGITLVALFLMGCSAPQYEPCCMYANATNETPICDGGLDPETGAPLVWELTPEGCDEEEWVCNVYAEDSEGNVLYETTVPICPRLEEVQCNTTCAGIFCGSFRFDPRPLPASVSGESAYPFEEEESEDEESTVPPRPSGLLGAECALKNITPLFLRHIENSDSLTLNTLRFGVGNSFEDFEDAQYYFPLSDRACALNPVGEVDRYVLYAIPNMNADGTRLCDHGGLGENCEYYEWICSTDESIYSHQFSDCAARCALSEYGYAPEIDGFKAYTTRNDEGELTGNPFAYGLDKAILGNSYDYVSTKATPPGGGQIQTYRGVVEPLSTSYSGAEYRDEYPYGTTLYGATFGYNGMSFNSEAGDLVLLAFLAKHAPNLIDEETFPMIYESLTSTDYYAENTYTNEDEGRRFLPFYFDWTDDDDERSSTVFTTIENDPHQIYPWLLTHHSIYNRQILEGEHVLMNGSKAGGAEFECSVGTDCISGFCNTFDYSRGACIDTVGHEVNCDCTLETHGVVCKGTRAYTTPSWDQPEDDYYDVEASLPIAAAVSYYDTPGDDNAAGGDAEADEFVTLPSLATVEVLPVGEEGGIMPVLIFSVGGITDRIYDGGEDEYGNPLQASLPTYEKRDKDDFLLGSSTPKKRCSFLKEVINPTSAGMVYEPRYVNNDAGCGAEFLYGWPEGIGDATYGCDASQWVAGDWCNTGTSFSMGGDTYYVSEDATGLTYDDCVYPHVDSNTILQAYMINSLDGEYWGEHLPNDVYVMGCVPYSNIECSPNEQSICIGGNFIDQDRMFWPEMLDRCIDGHSYSSKYLVTTALCFSRSAQDTYDLPTGFVHHGTSWEYVKNRNPEFSPIEPAGYDVCKAIDNLAEDESTEVQYQKAFCYQWASGGRKAMSDADVCVAESLAILVVTPHVITNLTWQTSYEKTLEENLGRMAFGECLINTKGDDLELKTYGMCEGCGYLTMAKEHLVALPDDEEPIYGDAVDNYYNVYCPDMVVHTPHPDYSIEDGTTTHGSGLYDWRFFQLAPYEVGGFVSYEYGSNDWSTDPPTCIYPNGIDWAIDESEAPNPYRGLPYVLPNAFYINQKLEELMLRNVQPVIFADDSDLWATHLESGSDEDTDLLVLKVDGDEFDWSTTAHMRDMFLQRPELFIVFEDDIKEGDYYYLRGSFLANTLFNEGGMVLVSKIIGSQIDDFTASIGSCDPMDADCYLNFHSDIKHRGIAVRVLCPNCMNSIAIGYDDSSGADQFDNIARFSQIAQVLGYGNASTGQIIEDPSITLHCDDSGISCKTSTLELVDVISTKVVLQDGDSYCSLSGAERYDAILLNLSQIGTNSLQRYTRPVLISDLIIDRSGSCWTEGTAGEFMAYLGTNSKFLAKSGIVGVIYGDWESTTTDATGVRFELKDSIAGYRGNFYSGVFAASRNFAGYAFQTLYNEVPITPVCPCEPCTAADPSWMCNGHFMGSLDGPLCMGYVEGSNVKWQEMCLTADSCMDESEVEASTVDCTIKHNDGTVEHVSYEGEDIVENPGLYKDVIASIIAPKVPCFGTEGINLSFRILKSNSYLATPAVFSLDGNTSVRCDPVEGVGEFCGYTPPVSDYAMECTISKGDGLWVIDLGQNPPCGGGLPPACTSHTDCTFPSYCNEWGQCSVFCSNDADCLPGSFCNIVSASSGDCTIECTSSLDCPPVQNCIDGLCLGEITGCISDTDCGPSPAYCSGGECYYPCGSPVTITVFSIEEGAMELEISGDTICTSYYHLGSDYYCEGDGTDAYCAPPVIIE